MQVKVLNNLTVKVAGVDSFHRRSYNCCILYIKKHFKMFLQLHTPTLRCVINH